MNSVQPTDIRLVFDNLPGLYLILAPDFTIIAVSNAYLKATMTERESILGLGIFDVFPDNPEDADADGVLNLRASLHLVLQSGRPHEMAIQKYDIRKPDGKFEERFWSPLNTPVFNEKNELLYIIHNVVDVTNSRKAESNLKKSENDYQLLVNSVKDYAIFMVDTNGLIASWNSGAESIKGYTSDEIIGKPITIFYTAEDIKQNVPQSNLQKALQFGHFEAEGLRIKKDGTTFWANIVFTALKDEAGILYGYSKITRDITERKNDQLQLELLSKQINQSNDAIFTTDADRKITSWNIGAKNLYGYTKEEVIGKTTNELLGAPSSLDSETFIFRTIIEQGYWTGEIRRKTKAGKNISVRSSISVIKDNKGVITGFVGVSFDITLQKQLSEQINHLANIVDQSSEAIISRGIDQRFISWNKGAERLFGYSKEEAIGKTPLDLRFTALTEQDIAAIEKQVIEKGSWNSEREFFHKNKSSFFGTVAANAVRDEQGEITSLVFIMNDISLRKQLEDQLRKYNEKLEEEVKERTEEIIKSEKRFRALIENNHDIVSLLDESFKVFYRSPSASRITGWTDEEMIGNDGVKNIHPDDIDKAKSIVKEIMAHPGRPVNCQFRNQHKDGHYLWLEGVVINLLHDDYVKAIVFNFRDVTEKAEAVEKLITSENRFRALVENNYDIISLIDESFKIIYKSPSVTRVMGFDTEEMKKMEGIENVHPDDRVYAANVISEAMANPGKPFTAIFRRQHKNGHYVWLEGKVTNLLHDKQVKAIVTNFRDITERIKAEEKLAASEKFFRALIENSNDIITLMDDSFKLLYRSPAAAKLTGWLNEDMIGVDATKNIHPEDQLYAGAVVKEVMANPSKTIHSKFRMRHKDGYYLWIEGTLTNLLHDKDVRAVVFNFRDVTARIEAEAKLAASEMRFRMLIENSADGIDLSDEFSNNIYRSPGAIKITGILPKENQRSFTHPDDLETIKNLQVEFIKKPGIPIAFQARFRHALGHYIWVEGTVTNLLHVEGVYAYVTNFRDITERKVAEQQKEFDANNLHALINNTYDLMWSVDRDYNLITSNEAFDNLIISLTGKKPVQGNNLLLEEFSNTQIERYKKYYNRAFSGESFTEIENDENIKDFWIEISFYPIYEGEIVIGTACHSRNISEKIKANEKIRKSNERFELVVTATNDVIWDWDLKLNSFWRNRNYYSQFGYDEKIVPADASAWHDSIHPEDKKRVLNGVKECIKNKQHFWMDQYRYLKSDQTVAFVQDSGYILYSESGKAYRMVGAMLDITDRKKAEEDLKRSYDEKQELAERMSIILNTLPANIALLDSNGFIIDVNDAWRNFANDNSYKGSNNCIGDNYITISRNALGKEKEDGHKVADGIEAVLSNKEKEFVYEYTCHGSKIKRWFRMVVTPLKEKEYAGAVVMHIDISELRILEQEKLKAKTEEQKKLTKAILIGEEKERNRIGQELHDNINQILIGTKLYLVIAGKKNNEVNELVKYPMQLIDSSIEEIRLLCHKMVTPLKNIDLEELVKELLIKFSQTSKINTEFIYSVTNGILSDDLQLNIYRIIQELLNNIIKYAEAKQLTITITTHNQHIDLCVTDDGKGFDPRKKRSGIGISNMTNRVKSFNGEIDIESSAGKGCKTSISIPY